MSTTESNEASTTTSSSPVVAEASTTTSIDPYPPYTPHGPLVEDIPGMVYTVMGSYNVMPGCRITRTMTIVKNNHGDQNNNELTIINAIRVDPITEQEILHLGTITNLVRLCGMHGYDDPYYYNTFKPKYYSILSRPEYGFINAPVDVILTEDGELPLPNAKLIIFSQMPEKQREANLWIPNHGGILFSVDAIQNSGGDEYCNWIGKNFSYMFGFSQPCACVFLWRLQFGKDAWPHFERLLSLDFDHVFTGHGRSQIGGAKVEVEKNLRAVFQK